MNGRMTGISHIRRGAHRLFHGRYPGFRRGIAVDMGLRTLSGTVIEREQTLQPRGADVQRAARAIEKRRAVETVRRSVRSPVIISGSLQPGRISLRRTVKKQLPGSQKQHARRQFSGNGDLPLKADFSPRVHAVYSDGETGDVFAAFHRARGVAEAQFIPFGGTSGGSIAPAQRGAVHPSRSVDHASAGTDKLIYGQRMQHHAQRKRLPGQPVPEQRQMRGKHGSALIRRGHACRRVHMAGPRQTLQGIGHGKIRQRRDKPHRPGFHEQPCCTPLRVPDHSFGMQLFRIGGRNPGLFQRL